MAPLQKIRNMVLKGYTPPVQQSLAFSSAMVGLGRFELPTSPLSGVRSNQLSYRPELNAFLCTIKSNCVGASLFFKEVIQPQVPLGLPCYDFTPVMNHTVVSAPPEG